MFKDTADQEWIHYLGAVVHINGFVYLIVLVPYLLFKNIAENIVLN